MFIDPNAMLVLQEVSLDMLCDVCVEIGRERRLARFGGVGTKKGIKAFEMSNGKVCLLSASCFIVSYNHFHHHILCSCTQKVTVFDFSEIMERTEKRVGDEVLGAGPQTVDELRAIARRVKSKYLMRIQLKEKHQSNSSPAKQLSSIPDSLPVEATVKSVTNSVLGGVGGFVSMWKPSNAEHLAKECRKKSTSDQTVSSNQESHGIQGCEEVEVQYIETMPVETEEPFQSPSIFSNGAKEMSVLSEAFDLLGGDFSGGIDRSDQELLDAMDTQLDPSSAFTIDDNDFRV
jgi:hypothetical protein